MRLETGDAVTFRIRGEDGEWRDITQYVSTVNVVGWAYEFVPDGPPAEDETGGMTIDELIPEAIDEWRQVRDDH